MATGKIEVLTFCLCRTVAAMDYVTESSDIGILDLLRKAGPLGVSQLSGAAGVTATAVRQRPARPVLPVEQPSRSKPAIPATQ